MLFFSFLTFFALYFLLPATVQAQCPVCVVTVGGGMLLAQKLGIDDFLASLWLSALTTSIAYWLATKATPKIFQNPYLVSLLLYLTVLIYFKITDQIGAPGNTLRYRQTYFWHHRRSLHHVFRQLVLSLH